MEAPYVCNRHFNIGITVWLSTWANYSRHDLRRPSTTGKCREQHQSLFLAFIDLTKAFDTVNRDLLWKVSKFGCPAHFLQMLHAFHNGMPARVRVGGHESDPFDVLVGVKQGYLGFRHLQPIAGCRYSGLPQLTPSKCWNCHQLPVEWQLIVIVSP